MLRMASRIASGADFQIAFQQNNVRYGNCLREFVKSVSESVVIDSTNVAQYYASQPDKTWGLRDFECSRPPFGKTFVEFALDDIQYGCLCTVRERQDSAVIDAFLQHAMYCNDVLYFNGFMVRISFNEMNVCEIWRGGYDINTPNHDEVDEYLKHLIHSFHVPLLTFSFMNCRNVTKRDVTSEIGPSAKWLRRQKAPEIRYHVLDINPMKEVLRTEGNIEANGLKKALHICRGHFAHYENGLFGRGEACTVWKPSHVRGSVENGIVDKDYRIKLK